MIIRGQTGRHQNGASARGVATLRFPQGTCGRCLRTSVAFTLIEVMIAIFVFSAVFIGFYMNLSQGFAVMDTSRENMRATQLLDQQMETIRLYTWSQINTSGFVPTNFTAQFNPSSQSTNGPVFYGTIVITNASMAESYASNFVWVTVGVTWTSANSKQHSRQMSTLVSQYGLHNYYY